MNLNYIQNYKHNIIHNFRLYLLISFILGACIAIGAGILPAVNSESGFAVQRYAEKYILYLNQNDIAYVIDFCWVLLANAAIFTILILSKRYVALIPLAGLIIMHRCFAIGYVIKLLYLNWPFRGILAFFLAVLPQNIIILTLAVAIFANSIEYNLIKQNQWSAGKKDSRIHLAIILGIVVSAIMQVFVSPLLMQIILPGI